MAISKCFLFLKSCFPLVYHSLCHNQTFVLVKKMNNLNGKQINYLSFTKHYPVIEPNLIQYCKYLQLVLACVDATIIYWSAVWPWTVVIMRICNHPGVFDMNFKQLTVSFKQIFSFLYFYPNFSKKSFTMSSLQKYVVEKLFLRNCTCTLYLSDICLSWTLNNSKVFSLFP